MKKKTNRWKPDTLLVTIQKNKKSLLFLLFLSLTIPFLTSFLHKDLGDEVEREGIVTIKGEEVFRIGLSSQTPHQEFTLYPEPGEYTVIEVKGPRIRIKEDSTTSQFAVQKGWIKHPGESAVSLDQSLKLKISSVAVHTVGESHSPFKPKQEKEKEINDPF